MQFSDDELRQALRRKDPGEAFTQKVMQRVAQLQARGASTSNTENRFQEFWRRLGPRPVLVGAFVALLAIGGSLGVLRHKHDQEVRAGEAAKRQALQAVRITNAKLNHVLERARNAQARE